MKDLTFDHKDLASIITFLPVFKEACYPCSIHEGAAICPFKYSLSGLVESVIMAPVAIPTETSEAQEGCLTSYSAIANYLLNDT